uniref:7TM_GPCR_Srx domain-containing protein n=1 Tax=Angiostrongylus cantonensis TaxID=6313 RepID=A0A0K0DH22_ANGCA
MSQNHFRNSRIFLLLTIFGSKNGRKLALFSIVVIGYGDHMELGANLNISGISPNTVGVEADQDEDYHADSISVPRMKSNGGRPKSVHRPGLCSAYEFSGFGHFRIFEILFFQQFNMDFALRRGTGTKRRASPQLSLGPGTNNASNSLNTTFPGTETSEADVKRKRRRTSCALLHSEVEYAGSSLFSKPTSATRPRHSAIRRYSPSPENRPVSKMKNVTNEFDFSKLPPEYDTTSVAVLECLKSDAADFAFKNEIGEKVTVSAKPNTTLNVSSLPDIPIKEELVSMESSDEDERVVSVVRMADIGAAPFTPTPISVLSLSVATKSRKKYKPPQPTIKLPRRKSLGVATRAAAGNEYSLLPPVITEQRSSVLENTNSTTCGSEQMCPGSSDSDNTHGSRPCVLSLVEQDDAEKEKVEGSGSVSSRPKRHSVGETLDFLVQDSSLSSTQVAVSSVKSSNMDSDVDPALVDKLQAGNSRSEPFGSEADALPIPKHLTRISDVSETQSLMEPEHTKSSHRSTSTDDVSSVEEKEQLSEMEKISSGARPKRCTIPVRSQGTGKLRNPSVVENAVTTSTLKHSATLLNVRRSSRCHTLSTKLRDFEHEMKSSEPWKPSKRVDPNSALSILRRVSKFTRPPRSPSPQPSTVLVSDTQDVKPLLTAHPVVIPPDENVTEDLKRSVQVEQSDAADVIGIKKELVTDNTPSENVDSDSQTVSTVSAAMSSLVQAGRISSRAVRPSSRFVNADFVSPLLDRKSSRFTFNSSDSVSHASTTVECSVEDNSNTKSDNNEVNDDQKTTDCKEVDDLSTDTVQPGPSKSLPSNVLLHSMETRRRSKSKKTHGVKIKLKIFNFGNFPRVRVVEDTSSSKVEEEVAAFAPEPTLKKKASLKKYTSPWSHYIPSIKPVLGNIYYGDGTVEKLGVSVNAVMDRLLAEVCQDGITRHSAIVNKREKRKRIEPFHQHELGLRARGGKHALLQKDFHYPSLKRGTKAEIRKHEELRRQRSRKVMSQLAESTRQGEEKSNLSRFGSTHPSGKCDFRSKPRDPSPVDPEKEERLRLEEQQREKVKRLTMPISFNTFLSSKTSVLTAQPLLQPQRSSNRAPIPDHFYRELLCEYSGTREPVEDSWNDFDMDVDDGIDVTTIEAVHIPKLDDYVAPPVLDQSAEPVAIAVEKMLLRPSLALEQPELRRNLLLMATECISALHIARLSAVGREAAVVVYNVVTFQASKMRDVICMFSKNCQVKSIVRSTQNDSNPWPEITRIVGKYVESNVVEPDAADLDRTIVQASLSDVVFVLVAPSISIGDFSVRDRHYDPVFRWLREIGNPGSVLVRVKIDETSSTTISDVFFTAVNIISSVVTKMVRDYRQKRVVLVGWGTTCCFNHVVLNSVPGVSAIIDLGYPLLTIDGPRGEPDDDILLTYCPTLFVVGAQACDYHPGFMKMMRSNMIMPSGLVVIGHANSNLLVSCATLSRLRITQRTVSRCIVEQICDFLSMEWSKRERSRLVPVPLNDTFKIDLTQLKNDEKAAHASRKPKDDVAHGRKRKLSSTPLQSPTQRETSPSLLPISQLDNMRSNFHNLLKKAGNEKLVRSTEERLLLLGNFKEPRPPTKSGKVLFVNKEFRRAWGYVIMMHIGVTDVMQLMIHAYSGMLFATNINLDMYTDKVVGAALTGLWFITLALTLFLTLNRLTTILLSRWFPVVTSMTLTYASFIACYISFAVPFALKLLPNCNYVFFAESSSWEFLPTDSIVSAALSTIGNYLILAIVILSVITYTSIFCYLECFNRDKLSKHEYRITIQEITVLFHNDGPTSHNFFKACWCCTNGCRREILGGSTMFVPLLLISAIALRPSICRQLIESAASYMKTDYLTIEISVLYNDLRKQDM